MLQTILDDTDEYRCLKHLSIFIALLLALCLWAFTSTSQYQFYGFSFYYH